MALDTHLKRPKVIKFKGRMRRFIKGLTTNEAAMRPTPAKRSVFIPSAKISPLVAVEAR